MKKTLCILAALMLIVCGAHAECAHNGEKEYVPSKERGLHDVFCAQCKNDLSTESCKADDVWHPTKDGKGHTHICILCGQQVGTVEKHNPVQLSSGRTICADCDAVLESCTHVGQGQTVLASKESGKHDIFCAKCGSFISSEPCTAGAPHPTEDGKGHVRVCTLCGQLAGAAESHNPVLEENGDTVCKDCGALLASCAHDKTEQGIENGQLITRCLACHKTLSSYSPAFSGQGAIDLGDNGSLTRQGDEGSVSLASNASGAPLLMLTGVESALEVSGYTRQALSISLTDADLSVRASVPKIYENLVGDAQSRISLDGNISIKNVDAFYGAIQVESGSNVRLQGALQTDKIVVYEGGSIKVNGLPISEGSQDGGTAENASGDAPLEAVSQGEGADAGKTEAGTFSGEVKLVLGENTITVNGTESLMDVPAYRTDEGFTMVPVQFVAKAFGVSESNIFSNKGSMTFFVGGRSITLTDGSNTALVNGVPVPMPTMTVVKQGRMMGCTDMFKQLLNVSATFDQDTGTLTLSNEN